MSRSGWGPVRPRAARLASSRVVRLVELTAARQLASEVVELRLSDLQEHVDALHRHLEGGSDLGRCPACVVEADSCGKIRSELGDEPCALCRLHAVRLGRGRAARLSSAALS